MRVVGLLPEGNLFEKLARAATVMEASGWGSLSIERARSWDDCGRRGRRSPPDLFVVDPCTGSRGPVQVDQVDLLVQAFPEVPVMVFPSCDTALPEVWIRIGRSGVADVIPGDERDSPYAIAFRIRRFTGGAIAQRVIQALRPSVPTNWRETLTRAYPLAHRALADDSRPSLTVPLLAKLWMKGATRDQLDYALRKEGLPPAGWLIRWLITLRAVLLRTSRRTWEQVALELGFGSEDALRRFVKRLTGKPPISVTPEDLVRLFEERIAGPEAAGNAVPGDRSG